MLADAIRAVASQMIGIGAALVQAKSEEARGFYLACAEFIEFRRIAGRFFRRSRR